MPAEAVVAVGARLPPVSGDVCRRVLSAFLVPRPVPAQPMTRQLVLGLLAAMAASVCYGVASVLQAAAARAAPASAGVDLRLLARLLRERVFLASVALDLVGFGCHLLALRVLPLFGVQAVVASSLAVTAVASARVLRVPVAPLERAAVGVVCLGLLLLAAGVGAEGSVAVSAAVHWAAALGVGATALVGVAAARVPGPAGAVLLGGAAGLGFSLVAVATRLLPGLSVPALLTDPATYALAAAGGLAALLYATALQRGSAVAATAPVVVVETLVPTLVGLLLLGDRTRAGGTVPAVAGFVLAVTGSVALARFGEPGGARTPPC